MKINHDGKTISHGMESVPSHFYLVCACQRGWRYSVIVSAYNEKDAIERLKANAKAVIESVRKELSPKDFEQHTIMSEISITDARSIKDMRAKIEELQEKLDILEERSDDFAETSRSIIVEDVANLQRKIRSLENPKPTKFHTESTFDIITRRMKDVLDPQTTLTADKIDDNRCIPVAYFDDPRSILNYCPH